MTDKKPELQMPKWLLYSLIAKGVIAVVIVLGVLTYVYL
jgi:hypothetical protein